MAHHIRVTGEELSGVKILVQSTYPGRKIVDVLAEKWDKHPKEEGLELEKVGLALMISSGRNDLYQQVINGKQDCFIDTYFNSDSFSSTGILLVVVILEKYDQADDDRVTENFVEKANGFSIKASLVPTPGNTYEIRLHELSHSSGTTTGFSKKGLLLARNSTKDYALTYMALHLKMYNEVPFSDFLHIVEDYRRCLSE